MFIRLGDKLATRRRYNFCRVFVLVWTIALIVSIYYWNHISVLSKALVSLLLGLTLPDSFWDLFRSYPSYRKEWEKIKSMGNIMDFPDDSRLEWVDRETLKYSEKDLSVLIWVDYDSTGRIIKASSIDEWISAGPMNAQKIADDKKQEIIGKVRQYYKKSRVE